MMRCGSREPNGTRTVTDTRQTGSLVPLGSRDPPRGTHIVPKTPQPGMSDQLDQTDVYLPATQLPTWGVDDLPEPTPLRWRNWKSFVGPGIVMCGIAIAGGEWLVGPDITARYGGSLMWIATIAIVGQLFYNIECGRYALYTGEPVMTGFMRNWPGPMAWIAFIFVMYFGAFIPAMSTNAASIIVAMYLDRPPLESDAHLVKNVAYILLGVVTLPILIGGKVYNMLQIIFTTKVVVVLSFCLIMGIFFVSPENWWKVFSGFAKFGNVPVNDANGDEVVVNAFGYFFEHGEFPAVALANIALLGAFAGYAGAGGLSNSSYSNYVRDKGWGMGARVGAIPSLVGGRKITLSHLGSVFPLTAENMRRWKIWWRYILTDQVLVWMPGCFMGMALPGLISIQFSDYSTLYAHKDHLNWAQALITADGVRHGIAGTALSQALWMITLFVGLAVLLPSQLAIVEDFARKWTDIIWSGSRRMRRLEKHRIKTVYYCFLFFYVTWTYVCAWAFNTYGSPKLMFLVIANFNNLALGLTAYVVLANNLRFLPKQLRPGWIARIGMCLCGLFYLGLATLVFFEKQLPGLIDYFTA